MLGTIKLVTNPPVEFIATPEATVAPLKLTVAVELSVKWVPVTLTDFPGEVLKGRRTTFGAVEAAGAAENADVDRGTANNETKYIAATIAAMYTVLFLLSSS